MDSIEFFVPGEPRAQTRPRTFRLKGGGVVTRSSSPKVASWRERVHIHALPHKPEEVPTGPVSLTAIFRFRRPGGHFQRNGELSAPGLRSQSPMGGKGDVDNLYKSCADALQGIFFHDDAQIVSAHIVKVWCGSGEEEGVYVTVRSDDS